jgi:hypothetical protein
MKPTILKHCSGRNYNSPFHQENNFGANLDIDKEQKTITPSLNATVKNLNANASTTFSPNGTYYNAGLNFNKNGFNAGVGVSGKNKSKPNLNAHVGYSKNF